jgi:hypothetical protein
MDAMEMVAPVAWKAKLKEQHVTSFANFQTMVVARYKDIQEARDALARNGSSKGQSQRQRKESPEDGKHCNHSRSRNRNRKRERSSNDHKGR